MQGLFAEPFSGPGTAEHSPYTVSQSLQSGEQQPSFTISSEVCIVSK